MPMKINNVVFGISGVARSGKNLFAKYLYNFVLDKKAKEFAFADKLKVELSSFIEDHYGVDVFTEIPEEKQLIRPLFVAHGTQKRVLTKGRYWIEQIKQEVLDASQKTNVLITDVRHAVFDNDEHFFIKNECDGILIHVSKIRNDGTILPPANQTEAMNDPIIKSRADIVLEIPEFQNELAYFEYLNGQKTRKEIESLLSKRYGV